MPANDIDIRPPAASASRLGGVRLTGDLAGPGSTSDTPYVPNTGTVAAHSHRRNMVKIAPLVHTNNGAPTDLYPAQNHPITPSLGNYLIVLNASTTFTLRSDSIDIPSYAGSSQVPWVTREPGQPSYPTNGHGSSNLTPQGSDFMGEVVVTFIQDDVGGYTPTVNARQLSIALGSSLGSGTAGQALTAIYRYLGPLVGWVRTYSSGWGSFPYAIAKSSDRGGKYLRAIVGTGADSSKVTAVLDAAEKSPLTFRRALYDRGLIIECATGAASGVLAAGNTFASAASGVGNGYTFRELPGHIVCLSSLTTNPVEATLHEVGHAADSLLLNGSFDGSNVRDDATLTSLWGQDKAEWIAAGGTDDNPGNSLTNVGWGGSRGYFVRTLDEWNAQMLGAWAYRRWAILNSNSSAQTTAETAMLVASNSTRRAAVLARYDALLAAYST